MTMSWHTQIKQQQNLSIADNPMQEQQCIPLPHLAVLRVAGDDATTFLQNLTTNDVMGLADNQGQLSGLCNPKGRLLAIFRLIKRQNDLLLLLPADLADSIRQRLTMFVLRSKVTIEDVSESLKVVALLNSSTSLIAELPANAWQGQLENDILTVKQPTGDCERYLSVVAAEHVDDYIESLLAQKWQLAPEGLWQQQDIIAGIPIIFNASKEQFTPQQVNLDLVGGVNFKKGCYPGQEVVARLHYLGEPKRRLYSAILTSAELPPVAMPVQDENGEVSGHIVQSQRLNADDIIMQLSMKLSALEQATFVNGIELTTMQASAS